MLKSLNALSENGSHLMAEHPLCRVQEEVLKKTGSRKNPTPRFLPKSNQTLKLYKLVKRGLFFFLFDINKKSIYIKDPILIVTNIQVFDLDKPGVITYFLRNNTQIELGIYRQSDSEFLC